MGILYPWHFHCFVSQRVLLREGGIACIRLIKHRTVEAHGKVEVWFHVFITSNLKVCGGYTRLFAPEERPSSTHRIGRLGEPRVVRTLWNKTSPCRKANHLPDRSLVIAPSWLRCALFQTHNNWGLYANCLSKISPFITSDSEFLDRIFVWYLRNLLKTPCT